MEKDGVGNGMASAYLCYGQNLIFYFSSEKVSSFKEFSLS